MTIIQFVQPPTSVFQAQVTLDSRQYTLTVPWLYWAQRYYATLTASDGTLVFNQALVGSPAGIPLEALAWANGTATGTTNDPHGYAIGDTIALTISGCTPIAYNGVVLALITTLNSFSYPLAANPGGVSNLGAVSYDINMAGGYFTTSTLVFRTGNQQFEIQP